MAAIPADRVAIVKNVLLMAVSDCWTVALLNGHRRSLPRIGRCGVRGNQSLAVGQNDVQDPPDRLAVLDGLDGYGDLISGFKRRPGPPAPCHCRWALCLHRPVPHTAGVVVRTQLQEAV